MQRTPALLATVLLTTVATAAQAAGDPAAGKSKSQACVSCHGETGNSPNPAYPRLAGQYASYLYQALKAYKNGDRQNPIMKGMVANLSDQDMRDLAAFYASRDDAVYSIPLDRGAE